MSGPATSGALNIAVLVFREGLECILVLAALTASFRGKETRFHRPVVVGVLSGVAVTLVTWSIAVRILNDLSGNVSALALQAGTGFLAILVLLIVMNWFFHKMYWTGWISLHNRKKQQLVVQASEGEAPWRLTAGMVLLGFTSFYREGFEVVLFLQSFRLRLGGRTVLEGVVFGSVGTLAVAVLTFVIHRHLPYRRMLVVTGVMLAVVLLVMVGEEAQEMQLAGWLPTTPLSQLSEMIPSWAGLWFSLFPTVETLVSQFLVGVLVFGSYLTARRLPGMAR
ncbi:MAG TPA: FTR1 family protein [Candidatus Sulfotelmatobacter sp.]|nr:FTR1 family protein [Candidatus Sulfotelmatobacter sp.]